MKLLLALRRFFTDDQGVSSVFMLALLPVFIGVVGLGMDGVAAFRTHEMLQSTADAAAAAAAMELRPLSAPLPPPLATAKAHAVAYARYYAGKNMGPGFGTVLHANADTNGDLVFGNWDGAAFDPAGAVNAVQVTVRTATVNGNAYPTSFLRIFGVSSWDIGASATAVVGGSTPLCVLILGNGPSTFHGVPDADLNKCSIGSNGDLTCTGHDLNALWAISAGTVSGCGTRRVPNAPPYADPYAYLAPSIPANSCPNPNLASSYPQEAGGLNVKWTGAQALGATKVICGDLQLTGDVTITTPAGGTVLVIENGKLDPDKYKFKTANGSSLTVVFSGPTIAGFSPTHIPIGNKNSVLDFSAPASGTWKGIALYQDPNLPAGAGVDIADAGNSPNWSMSGVFYLPKANVLLSGNVNGATAGTACTIFVVGTFRFNGKGSTFAEAGCPTSGIAQPAGFSVSFLVK